VRGPFLKRRMIPGSWRLAGSSAATVSMNCLNSGTYSQGDMSLVGPRPLPVYEVKNFEDPSQRRRLSVQPGITGLWQVNGRNKVRNFEDWVRLDLGYIDN
jgi:hypothetical protein